MFYPSENLLKVALVEPDHKENCSNLSSAGRFVDVFRKLQRRSDFFIKNNWKNLMNHESKLHHTSIPLSTSKKSVVFIRNWICLHLFCKVPPKNKQNKQVNLRDVGLSCDFSQEETQALLAAEVNSRHVGRDYT